MNAKTRYTIYCLYSLNSLLHRAHGTHSSIITDVVFLQRSSIPSQRTLHSTHVKTLTIHPCLSATCVLNAKMCSSGKKKNQCKRNGIHCVSFCQLLVFPFSYSASCKHRFDKHIFNKARSRTSQCSVTAKGYNSKAKKPKQTDTVINNV